MLNFVSGASAMGLAISALFFLQFWRRSRELLFLAFAGSFTLLAIAQLLLTIIDIPEEERSWLYLIRLAAFVLIIAAIYRQNRRTS